MLADDHFVVRMGLRSLFETYDDLEVVAEAGSGDEAIRAFKKHEPDAVLMDLRMPDQTGAEVTRRIRSDHAEARIIVLTTFGGDEDVYRALEAGAKAFLLKDTDSETLLRTVREVVADTYEIPAEIQTALDARRAAPELSRREQQVLELIVDGNSNKEIAARLSLAENTVKNHVKTIFSKLDVQDRTQAATLALQRGIVSRDV